LDEAQFKYELLDVLKDIGEYLAKDGDTKQMTAKLDKPPKIAETQKPLKGAEAPPFKPGKDALVQNSMLAKDFPEAVDEPRENETSTVDCQEGTLLKEDGDLEEYKEEEEEENDNGGFPPERSSRSSSRSSEGEDDFGELKSLLKDIKSALMLSKATSESKSSKTSKTSESSAVSKAIVDEIKKSLPTMINAETHRMLRKMGFSPSRSDVVKFGLDEDIKKSEDSLDEKAKEAGKVVDDLTHKSWAELGRLREATGQFNAFPR
jgi:hypothetical protein